MRHRKKVKKLGRTKSHREATLRNLARAVIEHHQVKTTLAKAKAARSYIERLITYGKKDTVAARRLAFKRLQNRTLVKMLFDEIAPAFADRNGGYTRVIRLGRRRGDGAELAVLQLVGFEKLMVEEKAKEKKKKKEAPAKEGKKEKQAAPETTAKEKAAATTGEETGAEEKAEEKEEQKTAEEQSEKETAEAQKPAGEESAGEEKKGAENSSGEEEKKE